MADAFKVSVYGKQEDLTPETTVKILDALAEGKEHKTGPQSKRAQSENEAGLTTCLEKVSFASFLIVPIRTLC